MTLLELIKTKEIRMSCKWGAPANPNMPNMDGWTVTLHNGRKRMTVPFYMGRGHHGAEPKVEDVLDCLLSESSSVDNAVDFADWCSEMGYEMKDLRVAQQTYKACQSISKRLHRFLGEDYETFAYADR